MAQFELMMAKSRVAQRMTKWGIMVDPTRFKTHRRRFRANAGRARRALQAIADATGFGENIKPAGHPQMHRLFFDHFGCKPHKWSEETGKPSLDESVLDRFLGHQDEHVRMAARALLAFRRWDKLRSTYIDGLPYDEENIVHPDWRVHGARTGRWSSSPNLQNIPKPHKTRKKKTPGLRDLFIPRPGYKLVELDYAALELRISAAMAGDEIFLKAFAEGADAHRITAAEIFGKAAEDITKDERHLAKTANYQMIYGGSPVEMWRKFQLDFPNITLGTVEKLHERWFDVHYWYARWHHVLETEASRRGFVECPVSGRRQFYADGEIDRNEILNFPVQGTGADIIDPALIELDEWLDWDDHAIMLQVHDALIGESRDWQTLAREMKRCMEQTLVLNGHEMFFACDVSVGDDWASMEEIDFE